MSYCYLPLFHQFVVAYPADHAASITRPPFQHIYTYILMLRAGYAVSILDSEMMPRVLYTIYLLV